MNGDQEKGQARLERVPSGVPGLDVILSGGFLRGGTYIVSGAPGTGKTILGNQLCFHHVANGGRVVYVTLLAESPARMLALLGTMSFFDPAPIASSLIYVSAYKTLEQEGLPGFLEFLRRAVHEHKATLLMIDGLVSAEAVAESELAFKKFIHELHTMVTYMECTTFLLTNGTARTVQPESTMVDGLIELSDQLIGLRAVRELVVRKFRGSSHLRGRHMFRIGADGIRIYPRREEVVRHTLVEPASSDGLLAFGVPEFDAMLHGGLRAGSTTLLLGPSGSGKTILGLHFLAAGARQRERGLYFSFFESPERVVAKSNRVGLRFSSLVERGDIEIQWQPLIDLLIDELAEKVLTLVQERQVQRLVIDGLGGFKEAAVYPERILRFLAAFSNELRALGVTTLLIEESRQLFGPAIEVPVSGLSAIFENVIFLRQVEFDSKLCRLISIIKTHDGAHETELREFFISKEGLTLASTFDHAESILSGLAHQRPEPTRRAPGPKRPAKPRKVEPSFAKPKPKPTPTPKSKPKPKPGPRRNR